ncbi:hypothetical protein LIER_09045 [Lithospermum erythrorhizon]|uniref:Uncharacterized protein n=1 Tax=Lithospermum erythrorhizon TaxID=34254 RepID=A0AAV3PJ12_LITER
MATKVVSPLEPWHQLNNKIVLVTGASSGLGREMCVDLATAGCKIIAAARRLDKLATLCDQINKSASNSNDTKAVAVELDVRAESCKIKEAVEKAWNEFGNVDVLLNNAGIRGTVKSSLDLPEEEWNEVIKTNYSGSWLVAKYIGQHMRDSGRGGSIINVSSAAGLNRPTMPGCIAYASSKAALNSITLIMALELGQFNIKVNSIALGIFRSEITEGLFKLKGLENVITRTTPLKTLGTSNPALTSLVRYLIHDSTSYVSGNVFIVDAGYTLPGFPIFSSL